MNYELMTITKIDLGEEKAKDVSKNVQDIIVSLEGKVIKADFWGKRKLAYEVNHTTEGYYDVVTFELGTDKVAKLKAKLNLVQEVIRYLVTAI